jgi:hypothetical protein
MQLDAHFHLSSHGISQLPPRRQMHLQWVKLAVMGRSEPTHWVTQSSWLTPHKLWTTSRMYPDAEVRLMDEEEKAGWVWTFHNSLGDQEWSQLWNIFWSGGLYDSLQLAIGCMESIGINPGCPRYCTLVRMKWHLSFFTRIPCSWSFWGHVLGVRFSRPCDKNVINITNNTFHAL